MKDFLNSYTGAAISKIRKKAKMGQDELAGKVGLSQSSVANIEAGRQTPQLPTLYVIATVLNVEITDLLPNKGEFLLALYNFSSGINKLILEPEADEVSQ